MMFPTSEEQERPAEWLSRLLGSGGYRALLKETASLPLAAYRLSCAICRVRPVTMAVPTLGELTAAARTLAAACDQTAPSASALLEACADAGLLVIEPMTRAIASRSSLVMRLEQSAVYA
jgi:hypothetical protein